MRIIVQLGIASAEAVRVQDLYPEVELVEFTGGEPPAGLQADAFFGGYMGWDAILEWLDAAGVGWVQLTGTGVDNVAPAVFEQGRVVTCARGASAVPISEWVMAAILAWAKRFPETFLSEPPRHWNFPRPALDRVEGTTVAIVGLGGIGAAVAQRALAFGMEVRALRRTDAPSPVEGVQIVHSLDDLLPGAAHVVLAAPATARTRHLIDADAFAKMTPGTHLVNIARGSLVDQDALRVALDDGTVAMATLDTVDPEPLPEGHWLYTHPQVRMTAHISWYTPQLQAAAIEIFIENIGRHRRGEPLLHVVDPHEGY
ncbi:MAG TPA: NAD(P)-dependent oxidoreductase [Acidimicrobiia bacterium]|nr:NAD(P)-dependent oxidoreductase [Acidimicrobiia bacterium]